LGGFGLERRFNEDIELQPKGKSTKSFLFHTPDNNNLLVINVEMDRSIPATHMFQRIEMVTRVHCVLFTMLVIFSVGFN